MSGNGNGGNPASFGTIRFDLATKLSILTALIFAGMDCTLEQALENACQINDICDSRVLKLKGAKR